MGKQSVIIDEESIDLQSESERLRALGVTTLFASLVDSAGVIRGKSVPVNRLKTLCQSGVGASPSWALFCADNAISWIPAFSAVGDHRLRADLAALVTLPDGFCWAPVDVFEQEGEHAAWCSRHFLRRQVAALQQQGIETLAAGELEFFLLPEQDDQQDNEWHAYGMGGLLAHEAMVNDLVKTLEEAGVGLEQFHAEYGTRQFELSLAPANPVTAIDRLVLTRILLGRIARQHKLRISFSPRPFEHDAGNGAHLHFSFTREGQPLLAGGTGSYGITDAGGSLLAGIVRHLPELVALLAPSVLSADRLQPGHWSGAYACWGLENREAAVRYCAANQGNPYGAHLEVKCIDPSANPYIACGAVLGMALAGLNAALPLPQPTQAAPADLSEAQRHEQHIHRLITSHSDALTRLAQSPLAQSMLPPELLGALIAVRQHEQDTWGHMPLKTITEKFRFAWSV
ncbi:putative Glutamine synthetase [Pantoea sp. AS-PWVM4]|uniref:glutamine synthetase family protein n=1 Tax=Pantoea sp. AS-PWVM4 TaxID=1332069 RepID=UPI0003AC6604|nr:glutamine synthetase family protein [Pantoea sp. AS-PWVM4]ERK16356.1 putative Glutamine synthetase [Pantoea sp. AS-PWVM4]